MNELLEPWNDDSGDILSVIYNPFGGDATISSMPNKGNRRKMVLKVIGTEETIGICVHQAASHEQCYSNAKKVCTERASGFDNADIRCLVELDNRGNPITIKIERIYGN